MKDENGIAPSFILIAFILHPSAFILILKNAKARAPSRAGLRLLPIRTTDRLDQSYGSRTLSLGPLGGLSQTFVVV